MLRAPLTFLALLIGAAAGSAPPEVPFARPGDAVAQSPGDQTGSVRDAGPRSGANSPLDEAPRAGRPGGGGDVVGPGAVRRVAMKPTTPANEPTPRARPTRVTAMPTITFFVARGGTDACGPGCAEWVAAEGAIDGAAPQRLRALLNRLGRRKLPIYFHSPGGSVAGALAIGRLMRERRLTAGVGWTLPQGCDAKQPREEACDQLKRSGRELPAQLDTSHTMCNSACVYALAGATVREIAPSATLGIHSSSFKFVDGHGHASGRPPPAIMRATMTASYERLARYLGEMGIDPALVTAARAISNDRVRFLTRAEIWRFNIDRRAFVEGSWRMTEEPTRAVSKVFLSDPKGDHTDFRTGLIRLTCSPPDRLRIDFARQVASGDKPGSVTLSTGAATRTLNPARRTAEAGSKTEYEVSTAYVAPSFLLDAGEAIAVADDADAAAQGAPQPGELPVKLSTLGLAPALATLLPSCGVAPTPVKMGAPTVDVP